MTHPLTPREMAAQAIRAHVQGVDSSGCVAARLEGVDDAADAILTALASGSGDHAELARIEETVIENLRARGMRSAGTPAIQDVFDALDEWKGIADREFSARTGAREEATKYKRLLSDLLCIIHRDGGHRIEDVGIEMATDEAIKLSAASIAENAALRGILDERDLEISEDDALIRNLEAQNEDVETRAAEAERKLAEAVGLLGDVVFVRKDNAGQSAEYMLSEVITKARTFLSKEAERG